MNSGSSAFISSDGQSSATFASSSCSQRSRPGVHGTSAPVRATTSTFSMPEIFFSASSVLALSGILRPPRKPSSAVMTSFDLQSWMRPASEAAEHHGVDRTDTGAGEHGVSRLGDHRQVDRDSVAALDPLRLQHIGEAADFLMQLAIGDVARFCRRIVRLPDDGDLFAALLEMPVDAVGRHVKGAVLEPFDRHVWIVERGVLDDGVGLEPVDALALFAPELVGLLDAFLVELLVFA